MTLCRNIVKLCDWLCVSEMVAQVCCCNLYYMFCDLCRDRAPFVFTSDMAYVINGGDKPSSRFHGFVDLCCEAYNLIRKHTHLFLNLLGLVGTTHTHTKGGGQNKRNTL